MEVKSSKRVSLKTIATEAGLSVSTVSEILSNRANNFSSEITKHKVRQIANAVGYRPNFGYKLMRGEKTKTVSIILADAFGTVLRLKPDDIKLSRSIYDYSFSKMLVVYSRTYS